MVFHSLMIVKYCIAKKLVVLLCSYMGEEHINLPIAYANGLERLYKEVWTGEYTKRFAALHFVQQQYFVQQKSSDVRGD